MAKSIAADDKKAKKRKQAEIDELEAGPSRISKRRKTIAQPYIEPDSDLSDD